MDRDRSGRRFRRFQRDVTMTAGGEWNCGGPPWYELSVDGVGTYWLTLRRGVVLGRATESSLSGPLDANGDRRPLAPAGGTLPTETPTPDSSDAFLPLLGPLARRHARIVRAGEGYRLEAFGACTVESKPVEGSVWLPSAARIALGSLTFRLTRPHPAANTALLQFEESNRTLSSVDGVILFSDVLVIGVGRGCLRCVDLESDIVLSPRLDRQTGAATIQLRMRSAGGAAPGTAIELPLGTGGCCELLGRTVCVRPLADAGAGSA